MEEKLWLLFTTDPKIYNKGRYYIKIREIIFTDGAYYVKHKHRLDKLKDKKTQPWGYTVSIIFNSYDNAIKYKKFLEENYYFKINNLLKDAEEQVALIDKEFKKEYLTGTEEDIQRMSLNKKLNKMNGLK